jgi:phosphotransferase system HPr-like phosphotransfer protein
MDTKQPTRQGYGTAHDAAGALVRAPDHSIASLYRAQRERALRNYVFGRTSTQQDPSLQEAVTNPIQTHNSPDLRNDNLVLEVEVANQDGFDSKLVSRLVTIANQIGYKSCDVTIEYDGKKCHGRGYVNLLDIKAPQGAKVKLIVSGNGTSKACIDELAECIRTHQSSPLKS